MTDRERLLAGKVNINWVDHLPPMRVGFREIGGFWESRRGEMREGCQIGLGRVRFFNKLQYWCGVWSIFVCEGALVLGFGVSVRRFSVIPALAGTQWRTSESRWVPYH